MATSGTYTTAIRTGYQIKLVWTVDSQSIPNNTSTVTAKVQLISTGSSYTINSSVTKNGTLTIDGTSYPYSFSAALSGGQTKTIFTKTVIVNHAANGTKTCSFSASAAINVTLGGIYYGTVSVSGTGTFDTIPRASTPSLSALTADMGTSIVISINRASTAFTHVLRYVFGSRSGTIANNVATSANWTIPILLAKEIPNATSGTGSIFCDTYNGSTLIGTKSVAFIATVPASVVPVISNVTISEAITNPDIESKFSNFVQHKSKANVLTVGAGAYDSTITSCKVTIRDAANNLLATYIASDVSDISTSGTLVTSDFLSWNVSTLRIGVTVTDSRGRAASVAYDKTLLTYAAPKITAFSAFRSDSSGNPDYEGQNLNVTINFNISSVNNLNDKYYEILYKVKGAASWAGTLASGNIYGRNDSFVTSAIFSGDNAYDLMVRVWDFFISDANGINASAEIPTAFTLFDCRSTGKGFAFGKVSEQDKLEIALDVELSNPLHTESNITLGQGCYVDIAQNIRITEDGILQFPRLTATLQNGWMNYGAGYESAIFWMDSCKIVHIAGLIKSGATAAETVIFNLPSGFRPRSSEKFFCVSLNAICVIDIYSSGNVAIKTGANSGWLSLSGISFRVAGG